MQQVIILKGLPGSGKTTWAKGEMGKFPGKYKRVSTDELRQMLDSGRWTPSNEKFMLRTRDYLILQALTTGKSVFVDATNLHPKHEVHILQLVSDADVKKPVEVIVHFFDEPLETCLERDAKRPFAVGASTIRKMYRRYIAPVVAPVIHDHLPWAVIVDLDGTLALLNGRSPYDQAKADTDLPNEDVIELVRAVKLMNYDILVTSGRSEELRGLTETWLDRAGVRPHVLIMRADGDTRKDAVVKRELYEKYIVGKYNVRCVFDDRQRVVDMWRDLGLTVFQVADGDF